MALVALLFSFVSFVLLLEYSSLYIYGIEILSEYMNTNVHIIRNILLAYLGDA